MLTTWLTRARVIGHLFRYILPRSALSFLLAVFDSTLFNQYTPSLSTNTDPGLYVLSFKHNLN